MRAWPQSSLAGSSDGPSLAAAAVDILHLPFALPPGHEQLQHGLQEVRQDHSLAPLSPMRVALEDSSAASTAGPWPATHDDSLPSPLK